MRCSSPLRCSASRRSRSSKRLRRTRATVRGRLRAAEAAAIVELNEERVRFSHPLLAARVEAELDPRRRRSLHRRLAELVGDPEQRARHLALGANGPSAEGRRRTGGRFRDRGLAWRVGGGSGAGRALRLAHAGRCRRPRSGAAGSCSRPTITTRAATRSDRRAILEPLLEQLPAWCRARGGVAAARRAARIDDWRSRSGSSSRRSSRPSPILG